MQWRRDGMVLAFRMTRVAPSASKTARAGRGTMVSSCGRRAEGGEHDRLMGTWSDDGLGEHPRDEMRQ
jgi:hypothetical protein